MDPHAKYLLVHPLPPAPRFLGREAELAQLRAMQQTEFRGVVALVGLGGAGKTALAARFLEELTSNNTAPRRLFLWSFYQEPDAGLFLERAYQFFTAGSAAPAKGIGLLQPLTDALGKDGRDWLVLDGLERVQFQESSATQTYGQIEDPLLRNLLSRIAGGSHRAIVLVTSRFPLTDLQPFLGRGYRQVDVGNLDLSAGMALLRQRGVKGDDFVLASLIDNYGAHALTLDHLGGLIGHFLEGNPYRAPELAGIADPVKDRQAFRLARLLKAYEEHLPPAELALLCRLCLLRRSVKEEHVLQFFLCSPPIHARVVREIADVFRRFPGLEEILPKDQIDDLADSIGATLEEQLCAAPMAGPEEAFRSEMLAVAEKVVEVHNIEVDFVELARLYETAVSDSPTDLRPLYEPDRELLALVYANFADLKQQLPPDDDAGKKGRYPVPPGTLVALKNCKRRLSYLAAKHFALRRTRDVCRFFREKWALAGPLATEDSVGIRRLLDELVVRHLVQREADGAFSVHPAVRDHFHRLAVSGDQGAWHDILRQQMVTLVQRPGRRLPHDPATLDLVEEAIYHAQQAGEGEEAHWLYRNVLGGLRHLGWKLGEMARGLRVLRSFQPCPEDWDLGWYLRALGEFQEAYAANALAYFRADILLLQGRLPEVAAVGDSSRTAAADFLMGKTTSLPPDHLGTTIPAEQLLLYLGRLDRVRRSAAHDELYRDLGWEESRSRCLLLAAEAARRQGDYGCCRRWLDEAAAWILHSGSVEHLCLLHLIRSRFFRTGDVPDQAAREVNEGLHIARQSGLGLFLVELLCEQAEVFLAEGDSAAAEQAGREAHSRALAADCRFLWGAAQAGHVLGEVLARQLRIIDARLVLGETLELRRAIGDPAKEATEDLLASLV